jgi:Heterokaryon incompatibility protein (HET)
VQRKQVNVADRVIHRFPFQFLRRPVKSHTKPEMRLLRMNSDGTFSLIQFPKHDVPSYAVLSHTWRGEFEITLQDVIDSTIITKTNENKRKRSELRQTLLLWRTGKERQLQYFWVDTCCIIQTPPPVTRPHEKGGICRRKRRKS